MSTEGETPITTTSTASETADLGLRSRLRAHGSTTSSTSSASAASSSSSQAPVDIEKSTIAYINAFAEKAPEKVRPYVLKAAPYAGKAALAIEKAIPIIQKLIEKGKELWVKLEPHKPQLLLPALIGFILCFFGGSFLTLIAAVEAYRMVGYETTLQCLKDLYDDFNKFLAANKEDDSRDDNNDGIPDAQQVSPQQLITRKTMLFLKTVDPKRISSALTGINAGFLAVCATLKLQFAKAITLGSAIGSILQKPAHKYVIPLLKDALPEDFKKWAEPVVDYAISSFAISLAWFIQRVLSAFHSALRGGLMFSRNIMEYLSEMKYVEIDHEKSNLDEIAGYGKHQAK